MECQANKRVIHLASTNESVLQTTTNIDNWFVVATHLLSDRAWLMKAHDKIMTSNYRRLSRSLQAQNTVLVQDQY